MHPIKMVIHGAFWDTQLYAGKLMLFDENGSIHTIRWNELLEKLAETHAEHQTGLKIAFLDGELLYKEGAASLMKDAKIRQVVVDQLVSLSMSPIDIELKDFEECCSQSESPFEFLPVDTEVYHNTLYAGGETGLYRVQVSGSRSAGHSHRQDLTPAARLHDGRVLQVKASQGFGMLAVACGADGLHEVPWRPSSDPSQQSLRQVAVQPCSACDWAFQSILGWTMNSAFFARYRSLHSPNVSGRQRELHEIDDMNTIMKPSMTAAAQERPVASKEDSRVQSPSPTGYSSASTAVKRSPIIWGAREKVYRLSSDGLQVFHYDYRKDESDSKARANHRSEAESSSKSVPFNVKGQLELSTIKPEHVIATATVPFGAVLELEDRILVIRSDSDAEPKLDVFDEEPCHWRVFPKSEHYSNQLHILYEDRVEIISFVHDYFLDQAHKLAGFQK